jgi:hypothetical protein
MFQNTQLKTTTTTTKTRSQNLFATPRQILHPQFASTASFFVIRELLCRVDTRKCAAEVLSSKAHLDANPAAARIIPYSPSAIAIVRIYTITMTQLRI